MVTYSGSWVSGSTNGPPSRETGAGICVKHGYCERIHRYNYLKKNDLRILHNGRIDGRNLSGIS
jgi:hypothetical protein